MQFPVPPHRTKSWRRMQLITAADLFRWITANICRQTTQLERDINHYRHHHGPQNKRTKPTALRLSAGTTDQWWVDDDALYSVTGTGTECKSKTRKSNSTRDVEYCTYTSACTVMVPLPAYVIPPWPWTLTFWPQNLMHSSLSHNTSLV